LAHLPARTARAAGAPGAGHDPAAFRCIDCHGGTSPLGRLRVKLLAARDAFWYVVGDFEEPTEMRWPLWDEDCLKCHTAFDESTVEAWRSPRFHQLPVHNAALGVDCVECHRVHAAGGNPTAFFLHAPSVRAQCVRCHPKFEEGVG
jgi:nitrate/TMAO reductase-like tetraheme cytochrome c subunit